MEYYFQKGESPFTENRHTFIYPGGYRISIPASRYNYDDAKRLADSRLIVMKKRNKLDTYH